MQSVGSNHSLNSTNLSREVRAFLVSFLSAHRTRQSWPSYGPHLKSRGVITRETFCHSKIITFLFWEPRHSSQV